jgi:multiple sugar transport system permease protein
MTTFAKRSLTPTKPRGAFAVRQRAGFFFVLPAVLVILVFFVVPLGMAVWVSLHNWPLFGKTRFIGIDNFINLASDKQFWNSLGFTTKYALLVTPPIFVLGFLMALLMNQTLRWVGLFRTAFFLPNVISLGAACLMWYFMLNDQYGLINNLLRAVGWLKGSLIWFNEYEAGLAAIIFIIVWKTAGGTMLLLLIGMQGIPDELYEAAKVDGAGWGQRLRFIMLPLMRRTFALALVLSVTGSYLAFDQFYILTRGAPQNTTITLAYWINNNAFIAFKVGYATSMSFVLMVILLVLNGIQIFALRDSTQY